VNWGCSNKGCSTRVAATWLGVATTKFRVVAICVTVIRVATIEFGVATTITKTSLVETSDCAHQFVSHIVFAN